MHTVFFVVLNIAGDKTGSVPLKALISSIGERKPSGRYRCIKPSCGGQNKKSSVFEVDEPKTAAIKNKRQIIVRFRCVRLALSNVITRRGGLVCRFSACFKETYRSPFLSCREERESRKEKWGGNRKVKAGRKENGNRQENGSGRKRSGMTRKKRWPTGKRK